MYDSTALDAAVGALLPLLIAVINQRHWNSKLKGVVALTVCVVVAAGAEYLRGGLDWTDWRNTLLVVVAAALASYHWLWKPSGIAPDLEAATTVSRRSL